MTSQFASRLSFALLGAITVVGCATVPSAPVIETVKLQTEDQPPGEVSLFAGSYDQASLFSLAIGFEPVGKDLGPPRWVGWTVKLGDYCRDRPSWVQSVVIGPSGQVWHGYRVGVPAGRIRAQDWSSGADAASGPGAVPTPGLLDAVAAGGRFTFALEDDEGQRWNEVVVDTLEPAEREKLFRAAPPPPPPVPGQGMLVVGTPPSAPAGYQSCDS